MSEILKVVPSGSKAGVTYQITRGPYGLQCSCPGFGYRQDCRHLQEFVGELDELIAECRRVEAEYFEERERQEETLARWRELRDRIEDLQKLVFGKSEGVPRGFRR